jgi:hypothetical protein
MTTPRSTLEILHVTAKEAVMCKKPGIGYCCLCSAYGQSEWGKHPWTVQTSVRGTRWNDRLLCEKHAREALRAGVPASRRSLMSEVQLGSTGEMLSLVKRSGGGTSIEIKQWAKEHNVPLPRNCFFHRLTVSLSTCNHIRTEGHGRNKAYFYVALDESIGESGSPIVIGGAT